MGYALCRRPPIIARCTRITDSWHCCKRILAFLVPQPVIWYAWWTPFEKCFGYLGPGMCILCACFRFFLLFVMLLLSIFFCLCWSANVAAYNADTTDIYFIVACNAAVANLFLLLAMLLLLILICFCCLQCCYCRCC